MKKAILVVIVLLLLVSSVESAKKKKKTTKTYYDILDIKNTASQKEVRKAYFKLAVVYHPDKAEEKDPEKAQETWMEISEAYEVLSEETKRARYDQLVSYGQFVYNEEEVHPPKRDDTGEQKTTEPEDNEYKFKDPNHVYDDFLKKQMIEERNNKILTALAVIILVGVISFFVYSAIKKAQDKKLKIEQEKERQQRIKVMKQKENESKEKAIKIQKEAIKRNQAKRDKNFEEAEWTKVDQSTIDDEDLYAENEVVDDEAGLEGEDLTEVESGAGETTQPKQQPQQQSKKNRNKKKEKKNEEEEDEGEEFYCAPCKKAFKSDSQWRNHEKSKKHLDTMKDLKLIPNISKKEKKNAILTEIQKKEDEMDEEDDDIVDLLEEDEVKNNKLTKRNQKKKES